MPSYSQEIVLFCDEHNISYSSSNLNPDELEQHNRCTYAEHFTSGLAIFPQTVDQIQKFVKKCVELKSEYPELAIYPISQGKNWGYGSATPTSQDAVLLSLQQIEEELHWIGNQHDPKEEPYGKKLGLVRVSASITQQQLYEFLQSEGGDFWMDATGAPKESSIVGNYLERGFGHTPMGDHFPHIVGMEVIMPDGSFVKTGHAGCHNAANVGVHKHGLGPVLEGLFSQSSLGIVTAIYLELMPAKKHVTKFFIQLKSNEDFYEAVERIRPLKMKGVLTSQMHCGNAHKGIQAVMRYPFKETQGKTPLPPELTNSICKDLDLSPWTISGAIYSDFNGETRLKKRALKQALKGVNCKLIVLPEWLSSLAYNTINLGVTKLLFPKLQAKLEKQLTILKELNKLKKGIPTNYFMDSIYWRKRDLPLSTENLNPDLDNVGMIWIAPIAPMTRESIRLMVEISTSVSEKYQFEPAISITLLNDKAADCILSIIFDRTVAEEEKNALLCYDELKKQFNSIGFTAYRASSRSLEKGYLNFTEEKIKLHSQLKQGLDPLGLFSPNHYL